MWFIYLIYPTGLLSIILLLLLFKYWFEIIFGDNKVVFSDDSTRIRFYFYTLVDLIAFTVWILFAIESSAYRNRISDYGAPYGGVLLLFLVPASFAISYFIGGNSYQREISRFIAISKLLWILSLVPGGMVVTFYILMMLSDR